MGNIPNMGFTPNGLMNGGAEASIWEEGGEVLLQDSFDYESASNVKKPNVLDSNIQFSLSYDENMSPVPTTKEKSKESECRVTFKQQDDKYANEAGGNSLITPLTKKSNDGRVRFRSDNSVSVRHPHSFRCFILTSSRFSLDLLFLR
jgi:hypothetical protein